MLLSILEFLRTSYFVFPFLEREKEKYPVKKDFYFALLTQVKSKILNFYKIPGILEIFQSFFFFHRI